MWTDEVMTIELLKTERGLGFSILDYQDPLNPTETVIVIRSLVPGGVAQQDGRLIPGDKVTMGPLSWRLELAAPQLKKGRLMEGVVCLLIISAFISEIWLIYHLLSEF